MGSTTGIPSRTAIGFVYAEVKDGPVFMPCMWTEVRVHGVWMPLDATQGHGRVGATHLAVASQSWHEERSLTPLLPLVRVFDRLGIEVVQTE